MAQNDNENPDYEVVDLDAAAESGPADALDLEAPPAPPTDKGTVYKVRYEGDEFLIPNIFKGRKWRDAQYILASLHGEYGFDAIGDAMTTILGTEQSLKIENYDYEKFMGLGKKVGGVLETLVGKPGK